MPDTNWTTRRWHRDWLEARATDLFDQFQHHAVNPKGGFVDRDATGRPSGHVRQLHLTSRLVHCFAIAARLARSTGARLVIAYCERRPNCRFTLHVTEPFTLPDPGGGLLVDVRFLNDRIEPIIMAHLDQWYFLDDRIEEIG